jgi:hypothetical protein
MRRFILIVMLIVLPLQASWGMVVAYGSHELAELAATPFAHEATDGDKGVAHVATDKSSSGIDDDCAVCHLAHHSNVILPPLGIAAPAFRLVAFKSPVLSETLFTSFPSPRPERPNWSAAV